MALTFHAGDFDSPDVRPLDGLRDASITFWAARNGGELVGVGALRELAADHGEVKSMRTAHRALGKGVGRAVLHHIVGEARSRGYKRLSLETGGSKAFEAAIALYEKEGFTRCGPFAGYADTPFSRFFTREL